MMAICIAQKFAQNQMSKCGRKIRVLMMMMTMMIILMLMMMMMILMRVSWQKQR